MFDRENKVAGSAASMWRRSPSSLAARTSGVHQRSGVYDSLPSTESCDPIPTTETETSTETSTATTTTAKAGPQTSRRMTAWDTRKTCVRVLSAACILGGTIPAVALNVVIKNLLFVIPAVACAAIPIAWDVAVSLTTCIRRRSNGFWHPGGHIAADLVGLGFNLVLLFSAGPLVETFYAPRSSGIDNVAYAGPALAFLVAAGIFRVTLVVVSCVEVYMLRRDAASVVESLRRQGWDIDPEHLRKKNNNNNNDDKDKDDQDDESSAAAAAEAAGKPVIPLQELHHDDAATATAELPQSNAKTPELMGDAGGGGGSGDSAAAKAELDGAANDAGWRPQVAGEYAELGG